MPADEKNQELKNTTAKSRTGRESGQSGQSGMIRIQLIRSVIGSTKYQRAVVQGLGLRRMNQIVERQDTPEIRGMVNKVSHLVHVIS